MFSRVMLAGCLAVFCLPGQLDAQSSSNIPPETRRLQPLTVQENPAPLSVPPNRITLKASTAPDAELLGEIRAKLVINIARTEAMILVEVLLAPECHVYSLTQNDPRQTRIDVSESPHASVSGPARPSRKPDPVPENADDPAEYYSEQVSFIVPLQLNNQPNPADLNILVRLNGMICSDKGFCLPIQDRVVQTVLMESVESLPLHIRPADEATSSRDRFINGRR